MRKFINASITIYAAAGILLFTLPREFFPSFYQPVIMGSLALTSGLLIILPRLFFRSGIERKKKALVWLQGSITLSLLINGAGGLGLYELYQYGIPYDKFAHFMTPLIFVIGLFHFVREWFDRNTFTSLVVSSVVVLLGGVFWEFLESFSDRVIGTSLFGGGTGGAFIDTVLDLSMNVLGVLVGILIIKRRLKH